MAENNTVIVLTVLSYCGPSDWSRTSSARGRDIDPPRLMHAALVNRLPNATG